MKCIRNLFASRLPVVALVLIATLAITAGCARKEVEEIKIGAILPLSGESALYGESIRRGVDLAVSKLNIRGGVHGRHVRVLYEDSRAMPSDGVSAFNKLVELHKVPVVLGDAVSSVTLAIAPIAEQKGVVVLSPLSSAPSITDAGDFIFRNVPTDLFGGQIAAHFATEQKWIRLAVLYVNNDFGRGLRDVFTHEVDILGGEVLLSESYEPGSTDFRTHLSKIKLADPQVIFLVGYREVAQILIQTKELGIKAKILGTGLLEDPNIISVARGASEGVYFTQLQYDPTLQDSTIQSFISDFHNMHKMDPDIISAYGYDAMLVLGYAIANSRFDAKSIKEELYKVKEFKGVTGTISFDENGDVIQEMGVKIILNGDFHWYKRRISLN